LCLATVYDETDASGGASELLSRRALEPTSSEDDVRPFPSDETFYPISDDEILESADPLPGETLPDLDNSSMDDIPVRILDNFAIYDWGSLLCVPISDLLQLDSGRSYGVSGFVQPWVDDDTDSDSDDNARSYIPQMIKLSPILELNIHNISPSTGILDA
jgi:DNA (cytosine-5)-methyltransferase 1